MTKPIERYQFLKGDLEAALASIARFEERLRDLFDDPFVDRPSPVVQKALSQAQDGADDLRLALETLNGLGALVGAQDGQERPSVTLAVDEAVA